MHSLGLRVIAEGIEHADQLQALAALDCECGQGYYFSRPLPSDEIEVFLARAGLAPLELAVLPSLT